MKKHYGPGVVLGSISLFSPQAYSQDNSDFLDQLTVVGTATYIYKSVDFAVGDKPFKPDFTALEWAFTAAYKQAYIRFNYDQSLKDESFINNTIGGSGEFDNNFVVLQREDSGITLGYSVSDNVSVFGGLKKGKSTALVTGEFRTAPIVNPPGTVSYVVSRNMEFSEDGPFIGVSYSLPMKKSGAFSFSIAYADLDGEVSISGASHDPVTGELNVLLQEQTSGEASGLSYSINWTDELVESMNYIVTLKTTRYKVDVAPFPSDPTEDFDFDEVYNIFSIGVSKFF